MKPTSMRNKMMYLAPMHLISKQLAAPLADDLQQKYHQASARVVEGDSVKVLRGEFKGIEGKVTHVSTEKRGVAIEGIKREKLKGGSVDIYIHPSNVMITTLNLEDKWRQSRLEGQKPSVAKPKVEESKEAPKPKEQPKEKKEEKKEQKPKQKETKAAPKAEKTETKSPKTKKSDK